MHLICGLHAVTYLRITVLFTIASVLCYANEHQVARWKISLDGLSSAESTQIFSTTRRPVEKDVRLIDWREWQLMKGYSHASGDSHTPMLIVAPEEVVLRDQSKRKTRPEDLPAEAFEDETVAKEEEQSVHIEKSISIPKPETASTSLSPTTETSMAINTVATTTTPLVDFPSSTLGLDTTTPLPINLFANNEGLDIKNLPNLFMLLKQLALIPAVVRSLSGGVSGTAPLTSAATSSSHPLFGMLTGSALDSGSAGVITSPRLHAAAPAMLEAEDSEGSPENQVFPFRRSAQTYAPIDGEEVRSMAAGHGDEMMHHPIVPVMTTYDSGKIRRPESTKAAKLDSVERFNRLNIYGLDGSAMTAAKQAYVAPARAPKKKLKPRFDLSDLTVHEIEQLESIHRKLFNGSSSDTSAEKPLEAQPQQKIRQRLSDETRLVGGKTKSEEQPDENSPVVWPVVYPGTKERTKEAQQLAAPNPLLRALGETTLEPQIIDDLLAIKELPDLEELTAGMDLSLLNKPGGFATLKQQFIERLVQRSLSGKRK